MEVTSIGFKIFMDRGEDLEPETWFRVFNTWIPEPNGDVLVDVADYSHVPDGPVIVLVGHHANYALDRTLGRFGFLYTRKRDLAGSFADRLEATARGALKAAARLDGDPALDGGIHFSAETAQIILNDRLNAPNDDATRKAVRKEVEAFLDRLYGGAASEAEAVGDERQRVTFDIRAKGSFTPSQLLENIGG